MTGAACLWVAVTIFFGIPLIITLVYMGIKAVNEDIDFKGALAGAIVCVVAAVGCFLSASQCQKCYDVNFAVAMKNINYTHTTEINTSIEMDYQDVKDSNKE